MVDVSCARLLGAVCWLGRAPHDTRAGDLLFGLRPLSIACFCFCFFREFSFFFLEEEEEEEENDLCLYLEIEQTRQGQRNYDTRPTTLRLLILICLFVLFGSNFCLWLSQFYR
jgi:hypothetical protein